MILTNPLYEGLMGDAEMATLFGAQAEIDAMIRVERALARAQATANVIPSVAAEAIDAELANAILTAEELAQGTLNAGVPVPPLVAALRTKLSADAAHWLHWGATTHDIMDCALLLRLRDGLDLLERRLTLLVATLADLAQAHVDTPMAGRTRSQIATPISFGLRVAYWLQGLLDQRDALPAIRAACGKVQFGGASGSNSATAPHGPAIIEALARELGLHPAPPWHTTRAFAPDLTNWCATLCGASARIAGDVLLMARREIAEIRLAGGGGSSTMPNKANPVSAEVVAALGRYAATLTTQAQLAMPHTEDRDSTAWMLEWIVIPQAMTCAASSTAKLQQTLDNMTPDPDAMARNLALDGGAALAEAASFALAEHMPRAEAQVAVKRAAAQSRDRGQPMLDILATTTGIADLVAQVDALARQGAGHEIILQIVERARVQ